MPKQILGSQKNKKITDVDCTVFTILAVWDGKNAYKYSVYIFILFYFYSLFLKRQSPPISAINVTQLSESVNSLNSIKTIVIGKQACLV